MSHQANQSADAHRVSRRRPALGLLSLALLLAIAIAPSAQAQTVGLGTAESFSVLAGSTVTNTGPTVINGDLGLSPGSAITGFPPGLVNGTVHATDAVALQAQNDLTTAYNDAAGRPSTSTVSGDLAGRTLSPGVYTSATSLGLSGDLTLDAQGDPSAVFVFQAGSTLTTASGSRVLLQNGAQACNVFWQVGSSATLGTATAFTGTIMALTSISLTTAATLDGRALARNGAVTLDTNVLTRSACAAGDGSSDGGSGGGGDGSGSGSGGDGNLSTGFPVGRIPGVTTGTSTTICPEDGRLENARLRGRVRPGTAASTYYFEFGTTTSYGRQTRTGRAAANARPFTARATARRLQPNTTYHYRIVGVVGSQTTHGVDRTFRTRSRNACSPSRPARPPRNAPPGLTG